MTLFAQNPSAESPSAMASDTPAPQPDELLQIDLRNPGLAAFLAWLWPGAGHLYQRRYFKGLLFMVCVLGPFFFGLWLGHGRVVYASWHKHDRRWQYICQVGAGLPALPALVQASRVFGKPAKLPLWNGFMAPPEQPVLPDIEDELARWHEALSYRFELGTLYTMIAGLLNVLAICDAYAGPFLPSPDSKSDKSNPSKDKTPTTA
jgi:hypothetical protein